MPKDCPCGVDPANILNLNDNCLLTVNAGTTSAVNDNSLGTATIDPCGETIHFWSPTSSIQFSVTSGSAVVAADAVGVPALPQPQIQIEPTSGGVPNAVLGAFSDNFFMFQEVMVKLSDADARLYSDPTLDARIELLRWKKNRNKNSRGQKYGYVHPSLMTVPTSGGNPYAGRRTRGGDHAPGITEDRITEWPLLGLDDHVTVGPIPVERFFRFGSVQVNTAAGGGTPINVTCPVITGFPSARSSIGNPLNWIRAGLNQYFCFRVTMRDPNGDGSDGDRLVGPTSQAIKVSPFPYPAGRDWANPTFGIVTNPFVNQLRVKFT